VLQSAVMVTTEHELLAVTLKPGRERSVRNRHPWLFGGAIASVRGAPADGDAVEVYAADGTWLARGTWSTMSQIRVRLWTWDQAEQIDGDLIRVRIRRAIAGRAALAADPATTSYRLIFSESDGLPGLIVDRYGDYLVMQLLTVGAAVREETIVQCLAEETGASGIYERSDAEVRSKEGLDRREGLRWGGLPDEPLEILESGYRMVVDLQGGQKTGAYLDQRANHVRVAAYCNDAEVLSCFSYTGGFEVHAAGAGATVITSIDSSAPALDRAEENMRRNDFAVDLIQIEGNVFGELRRMRAEGQTFDVIVLDPPKFAANAAQVERACRGYKDINLLAMQLLRPGGILATFSCSGLVSADLFQKVIFGASVDAKRDVQILERLTQGSDHPVLLSFPESEYLKGFICRVW
jgi:23S rRNA (cytosine1962-C5)-methyltransferase